MVTMRVLFAIGIAFALLESAKCQMMDCAYPTNDDVITILQTAIVNSDGGSTPTITPNGDIHLVCLAYSQERDRYRAFSVLFNFTCVGNAACAGGTNAAIPVVEQIESECENNVWSIRVFGQTTFTRTPNFVANFSTPLREDCSFCASPDRAQDTGTGDLKPDNYTHCIPCGNCEKLNRCFDFEDAECCNVYLPDDTCGLSCPAGSTETPEYDCVINCPTLKTVNFGEISYSTEPDSNNTYSRGTEASVNCVRGYESNGVVTVECTNGGVWSDDLDNCSVINCGGPPALLNGKIEQAPISTVFDTVVTYVCDDGYSFKDNRNTRTCQDDKSWSNSDLECVKEPVDPVCPDGCSECSTEDEKVSCTRCDEGLELKDNSCNPTRGSSGSGPCGKDNIICIIIPIAILLAIILAIIVAVAVYAYLKWRKAPDTKLREKDPEGINGVARDNPLYLDPNTVADDEGEE